MVLDDDVNQQPSGTLHPSLQFPPIPTTADEEFCLKMQEKVYCCNNL
jgi:hypothetical protein